MGRGEDWPATDDEAVERIRRTHAGKNESLTYVLLGVYWNARAGGEEPPAAFSTANRIYLKSIAAWHGGLGVLGEEGLDGAG
jgi:hypothetical protein